MIGITKKINSRSGLLCRGERAVAATALISRAIPDRMVARHGQQQQPECARGESRRHHSEWHPVSKGTPTMADSFPRRPHTILTLTNRRWVLLDSPPLGSGPRRVLASWAHDEIQGLDIERGALRQPITLRFTDGSAVEAETPKANRPGRVVEHAQKVCIAL